MVQPASGAAVQAVGLNNAGTAESSTATVSLNMPRGGGIIYAKAVTGIAGNAHNGNAADDKTRFIAGTRGEGAAATLGGGGAAATRARTPSLAETGWTADGERFVKMEIIAALGGPQRVAYITASGKRYPAN